MLIIDIYQEKEDKKNDNAENFCTFQRFTVILHTKMLISQLWILANEGINLRIH